MEEIVIQQQVVRKLNNLLDVLLLQAYFIEEENALAYLKNIRDFIQTIPTLRHRPTKNSKHGAWYAEYKPNPAVVGVITNH